MANRRAREFYFSVMHKNVNTVSEQEILVKWEYPKNGYYKLNTDGASSNSHFAGIGGAVRDDDGSFVAGFAKHIYQNGCNMTEVWEVRNGLQTVIQPGIKKLEVDCDSTFAIV